MALEKMYIGLLSKQKIKLFSAGRTDAGVHSSEQSAHFDTKSQTLRLLFTILNTNKGIPSSHV